MSINNGLGKNIGKVIAAIEFNGYIELTMEIEEPVLLAKPLMQSFGIIGGKD